jgi:hypothetical protein
MAEREEMAGGDGGKEMVSTERERAFGDWLYPREKLPMPQAQATTQPMNAGLHQLLVETA